MDLRGAMSSIRSIHSLPDWSALVEKSAKTRGRTQTAQYIRPACIQKQMHALGAKRVKELLQLTKDGAIDKHRSRINTLLKTGMQQLDRSQKDSMPRAALNAVREVYGDQSPKPPKGMAHRKTAAAAAPVLKPPPPPPSARPPSARPVGSLYPNRYDRMLLRRAARQGGVLDTLGAMLWARGRKEHLSRALKPFVCYKADKKMIAGTLFHRTRKGELDADADARDLENAFQELDGECEAETTEEEDDSSDGKRKRKKRSRKSDGGCKSHSATALDRCTASHASLWTDFVQRCATASGRTPANAAKYTTAQRIGKQLKAMGNGADKVLKLATGQPKEGNRAQIDELLAAGLTQLKSLKPQDAHAEAALRAVREEYGQKRAAKKAAAPNKARQRTENDEKDDEEQGLGQLSRKPKKRRVLSSDSDDGDSDEEASDEETSDEEASDEEALPDNVHHALTVMPFSVSSLLRVAAK